MKAKLPFSVCLVVFVLANVFLWAAFQMNPRSEAAPHNSAQTNPAEQRKEMSRQLAEIAELLKAQNELLKTQNQLLTSGNVKVVVSDS